MKDTQHTPGPWAIHESAFSSSLVREFHIGVPTRTAAVVYDDTSAGKLFRCEVSANARLIAAAPTMQDALEATLDALDEGSAKEGPEHAVFRRGCQLCAAQVRAAIARATGGNAS